MGISDDVIRVLGNHHTQRIQFNYTGLAGINITVNRALSPALWRPSVPAALR